MHSRHFLLLPVEFRMQPLDPTPSLRPHYQPSSLKRVGLPRNSASVLLPRGFFHLCFSLNIGALVPAVPHESPSQIHAPYTPVAACPVFRHPASSSQKIEMPLVSTTSLWITTHQRRFPFSRLSDPYRLEVNPRRFGLQCSPPTAFDRSSLEWFEACS